jgi:hypothetical protein
MLPEEKGHVPAALVRDHRSEQEPRVQAQDSLLASGACCQVEGCLLGHPVLLLGSGLGLSVVLAPERHSDCHDVVHVTAVSARPELKGWVEVTEALAQRLRIPITGEQGNLTQPG